jgi:hypothetical protein
VPISADELRQKLAQQRAAKQTPEKPPPKAQAPRQPAKDQDALPDLPQIEQAVLQVIFANADAGFSAFEHSARKSFFVNPVNRELYNSARHFYQQNGRLDWIAFTAYLTNTGRFEELGGHRYITELFVPFAGATPPFEMLGYYIGQLGENYVRRQLIVRSFALASKARNQDVASLLVDMAQSVTDLQLVSTGKTTLCDATNYLNGQAPPLPFEIVYHLLHQGSKMIVGGTSKGRKTMALIDLALSVATGTPWWGFNTRRGAICYINFEIQEGFFWYRVNEICQRKEIAPASGMFYAWNLRGRAEGIERLLEEILSVLKQVPFVLIIIDPIYKALGGRDENRAGDVASMLNEIEKIAVRTEAAVAFGAHYSKGNQAMKESIDRIGGSGVFARDPDTILTMTAHEEEECFTVETTLRNFSPLASFVVKWEWPLFTRIDLDPGQLKGSNPGEFRQEFTTDMLLDHLSIAAGIKTSELRKLVDEKNGMSKSTFYNLKAKILRQKLAIERNGELFRATNE